MANNRRRRILIDSLLALSVLVAIGLGIGLGVVLARTHNLDLSLRTNGPTSVLPTRVLDRNGQLITQFYGAEKREVIPLDQLPKYLVYALITREDQNFFRHHGFSVKGTFRAFFNIITGQYVSGGSTITQQLAGTLYADRNKKTILRKIKELWYAVQLERRLTKDQILQEYLNTAYFGRNTYGIEAASQFYFGHSARDLTLAESAMLVIQLANPARYYPYKYPNRARTIQHVVLEEMVKKGYVTQTDVDLSFKQFWQNYDYTRPASSSPFTEKDSKAPYFTEYVRQKLEEDLYGKLDYLRDGLVIHTTLNLDYQKTADEMMKSALSEYNSIYQKNASKLFSDVNKNFYPVVSLLSLSFDLNGLATTDQAKAEQNASHTYLTTLNPTVDVLSMLFGLGSLHSLTINAHEDKTQKEEKTTIEGALITLDNSTGEILSMVGGYDYSMSQFNRAVDSKVQPGSSFKPLYYSAAISSGKFTPATRIYDGPIVFYNSDGTPYRPYNYLGEWSGHVLLWWALADSMNVPSLQVLDGVGFDAAIDRASQMLGMQQFKNDPNVFPHVYPLGLGITPVAPLNMARAYAVFPNQGREVDPVAIKYIQDRNGNVILEPEKQLRAEQKRKGKDLQIMSPQTAYVMVSLLKNVIKDGTLWWATARAGGYDGMPMAGKTGTTQNWSDAWTIGFSPYYTTAIWFGFDKRGGSLGLGLTGATAAGPVWARYMKAINKDLPRVDFQKPTNGIVTVKVDADSGLLPTTETRKTVEEVFIAGTEPRRFDNLAQYRQQRNDDIVQKLQNSAIVQGFSTVAPGTNIDLPDSSSLAGSPSGSPSPPTVDQSSQNIGSISASGGAPIIGPPSVGAGGGRAGDGSNPSSNPLLD